MFTYKNVFTNTINNQRNMLLIALAAIALTAGSSVASAQQHVAEEFHEKYLQEQQRISEMKEDKRPDSDDVAEQESDKNDTGKHKGPKAAFYESELEIII
jgi:Ni/Co efflux regulator RcnB